MSQIFNHQNKIYKGELSVKYDLTGGRYYKLPFSGRWVPSVTTVLDKVLPTPELDLWRSKIGKEEADKYTNLKARIGENFHNRCENYIKHVCMGITVNSDIYDGCVKFEEYMRNLKSTNPIQWEMMDRIQPYLDIIHEQGVRYTGFDTVEEVVWSEKLGMAGRLDCLFHMGTKYRNVSKDIIEKMPKGSNYEYGILDFKTYKERKTKKELLRYFLQMAAYAEMVSETFQMMKPKRGLILSPCMADDRPQAAFSNLDQFTEPLNRVIQSYKRKYADDFQENDLNIIRLLDDGNWSCGVYI